MSQQAGRFALIDSEIFTLLWLIGTGAVMIFGWLAPAAGLTIQPWPILGASAALTVLGFAWLARGTRATALDMSIGGLAVGCAVMAGFAGYLFWLAWPSFFPVAEGPDLVHHLTLIHFLQDRHTLPADPAFGPYLGEMTGYPPGSHLIAAMAGTWTGLDAIRLVHPVMALAVAAKAGLIFQILVRLLRQERDRLPLALCGAVLLLAPHAYLLRPITYYGFYAQVLSESFAVAMLWTLVAWHGHPDRRWLALAAIAGIGVVLTWPVFLPAPALALMALIVFRPSRSLRQRAGDLAVALGPVAIVTGAFVTKGAGSAGILSSGGDVLVPAVALFGWPFLALTGVGLLVTLRHGGRHAPISVFVAACVLQVTTLIVAQHLLRATNYYLGFKTVHLLVYGLVILAAIGLAAVWRWIAATAPPARQIALGRAVWLVPLVMLGALLSGDIPKAPLRSPLTEPVHHAGTWAKAHVPPNCVDYLVPRWLTAYWLHVDVLGNARASADADEDRYDFHRTIGRWIDTNSNHYAVVEDWTSIPSDAREHMRVLAQFGSAAVVERSDGHGACHDSTPTIDEIALVRTVHPSGGT